MYGQWICKRICLLHGGQRYEANHQQRWILCFISTNYWEKNCYIWNYLLTCTTDPPILQVESGPSLSKRFNLASITTDQVGEMAKNSKFKEMCTDFNFTITPMYILGTQSTHTKAIIKGTPSDFMIAVFLYPLPSVNSREERYFIGNFRVAVFTTPMNLRPRPIKVWAAVTNAKHKSA